MLRMVLVPSEQNLVRATPWTTAGALPELWGLSDVQWCLDKLLFPDHSGVIACAPHPQPPSSCVGPLLLQVGQHNMDDI